MTPKQSSHLAARLQNNMESLMGYHERITCSQNVHCYIIARVIMSGSAAMEGGSYKCHFRDCCDHEAGFRKQDDDQRQFRDERMTAMSQMMIGFHYFISAFGPPSQPNTQWVQLDLELASNTSEMFTTSSSTEPPLLLPDACEGAQRKLPSLRHPN